MKNYIYTLWSKPWVNNFILYDNILYFLLSIELVKKHSSNIKIYTDNFGKILLNKLNVDVELNVEILNNMPDLHIDRWAIPKLYVMNAQENNFCHIDHDVFLWESPPDNSDKDIILQNIEKNVFFDHFYKSLLINYVQYNTNIYKNIYDHLEENDYGGYNCGYIEVNNIDFCKKWVDLSLKTNNNYLNNFRFIDNTLVEQFLLYSISKNFDLNIEVLIPNCNYHILANQNYIKYTHLMGSKRSNRDNIISSVENKLQKININLYNNLKDIFSKLSNWK